MHLMAASQKAGKSGVIARRGWTDGKVLLVRFYSVEGEKLRLILLEATDHSMGNYQPIDDDTYANDWEVVAQSIWKHT